MGARKLSYYDEEAKKNEVFSKKRGQEIFFDRSKSALDYFTFGMLLPNRHGNGSDYRYGFNGYEKDDEVSGEGNSLNSYYRHYDPRIGRFKSLDPMMQKFPWQSPYVGFDNNPVLLSDLTGGETDDWVKKADGSVYWDANAKSQATTKEGETYLSADKYNKSVVDAIGSDIMNSDNSDKGYDKFIGYVENELLGKNYFLNAARKNYQTNAEGFMKTLTDKFKSVEDGILISQMTHFWVDEAGWTENRNQLEHWMGMFILADEYGPRVASTIGLGNEFRGLVINDRQNGNAIKALEGKPAKNGGPTAFEWKDLYYNDKGLDKWKIYRNYYPVLDLNGDGKVSVEENRIFNEKLGGLGE